MENMNDIKPRTADKTAPLQFSDVRNAKPEAAETKPEAPAPVEGVAFEEPTSPAQPETATEDVKTAPPEDEDQAENSQPETADAQQPEAPAPTPKQADKPHGIGLVIFAAVVIVLGLGAMLTYAYLQTQ